MQCLSCQAENEAALRFCTRCGTELPTPCPACGRPNRPAASFCGHCAAPLGAGTAPRAAGERRQITVLFCDLVGSSGISERLDPEDWRDLLQRYQARCAEVVRNLGGHVAQYLGDGLLVYFGYPVAHENSPERAVRAGLAIVEAVRQLAYETAGSRIPLQVRVGIHTGPAVVGEMGDARRPELLAVGETPNVAARVQSAAASGTVVVSEATHRCVRGHFDFRDLGPVALKGFTRPASLYEVEREADRRARLELGEGAALTPLTGRSEELGILLSRWDDARAGRGPVVLVGGEAGIGKSRLVRVLRDRVVSDGARALVCLGSPLFQGTALHPVREMLEAQLGFDRATTDAAKAAALATELGGAGIDAPEARYALASLLSIPLAEAPPGLTPQRLRQLTFDAICDWLSRITAERPTLLVFEDLHWADPSTLELLGALLERPAATAMIVATHRPEFVPPWTSPRISTLALRRLPAADARRIIAHLAEDAPLPSEVVAELLAKADGVPLYVEEITKSVLESRAARGEDAEAPPSRPPMSIPATVQDSLTARLDRLGTGKPIVQLAATLGRTFRLELLQAVSNLPEAQLRAELDRLVDAEMLFVDGETYTFKHALIQDAAYDSLLRGVRQANHARIARALVERFPEIAQASPELLAQHYAAAGAAEDAIAAWMRAGEQAIGRSAYLEARAVFGRALDHVATMPPSREREGLELQLRMTLGVALISTYGYSAPEVERNYARAGELCEALGDLPVQVLYGVWAFQLVRSDREGTARLVSVFERIAHTATDPDHRLIAYAALGVRAFWCARYADSRRLLETALSFYDTKEPARQMEHLQAVHGFEGYLYPLVYLAWCDLVEGDFARSHERWTEALAFAEKIGNSYAIATVLSFGAHLAYDSGDVVRAHALATRQAAVAAEHGFPFWLAIAQAIAGWADVRLGRAETGLEQIESGLRLLRQIGGYIVYSYLTVTLADAHSVAGQLDLALRTIDETLAFAEGKLALAYEPSMRLLRGGILEARGDLAEAEIEYSRALSISRDRGARLFELRAALPLARRLRSSGRLADAKALLAPLVAQLGPVPGGVRVVDLEAARELLGASAGDRA